MSTVFNTDVAVVVLKGRFAGKKGVVVSTSSDGKTALVVGIRRIVKVRGNKGAGKMNAQAKGGKAGSSAEMHSKRVRVFIKSYNTKHLLATRYCGDINIPEVNVKSKYDSKEEKDMVISSLSEAFSKSFVADSGRWIFSKLSK